MLTSLEPLKSNLTPEALHAFRCRVREMSNLELHGMLLMVGTVMALAESAGVDPDEAFLESLLAPPAARPTTRRWWARK